MSRPDEGSETRAWEDRVPTFRERLGLAIRQNPVRGVVILLLLLLSAGFLVAGIVEFRSALWDAGSGAVGALLGGEPAAVSTAVVVLVAVGTAVLLLRRG